MFSSPSFAAVLVATLLLAVYVSLPPGPPYDYRTDILPHAQIWANVTSASPLQGRTIVVTGATSGIGKSLTKVLLRLGAHVVAVGRSPSKLQQLEAELMAFNLTTARADFADLAQVAATARQIRSQYEVDVLVNNAGVFHILPEWTGGEQVTSQGYEEVFAVNYLSHVLWTELLVPALTSADAAVIQVSSSAHFVVDGSDLWVDDPSTQKQLVASQPGSYPGLASVGFQRYGNSKLAQILHACALSEAYPNVRVASLCPGGVATSMGHQATFGALTAVKSILFDSDGWGLASLLQAIMPVHAEPKEAPLFYANTEVFHFFLHYPTEWLPELFSSGLARELLLYVFGAPIILLQRWFPLAQPATTSAAALNATTSRNLYEWSLRAVDPYLVEEENA